MLYKDPETGKDLFDLIDDIELLEGDFRIRLSSIEPYGLSEERIRGFSRYKRLCPHFHIPLQSGSDKVLMDMKRDYKTSDIRKVINYIKELMPDSTIGADIITGYPTEDSDDFEKTLKFIQSEPIDYLHVFRFSPRPGTFAARIRPLSSESEVKIRSETLIRLSREKRIEAAKRFIGKEMGIVITSNSDKPKGLTHNYLKVVVNRDNLDKGKIYNARLLSLSEDGTIYGEIL
jgi:threonylcarbamoyladenosine tRNA methylthiotransferase MtaB